MNYQQVVEQVKKENDSKRNSKPNEKWKLKTNKTTQCKHCRQTYLLQFIRYIKRTLTQTDTRLHIQAQYHVRDTSDASPEASDEG